MDFSVLEDAFDPRAQQRQVNIHIEVHIGKCRSCKSEVKYDLFFTQIKKRRKSIEHSVCAFSDVLKSASLRFYFIVSQ